MLRHHESVRVSERAILCSYGLPVVGLSTIGLFTESLCSRLCGEGKSGPHSPYRLPMRARMARRWGGWGPLSPNVHLTFAMSAMCGAGLSLVDTFSSPTTNESLNTTSQLAMPFATQVFITLKVTTHLDSLCSTLHLFSGLERCQGFLAH